MDPTQLSRNFWLREFLKSEIATRMGRILNPDDVIVHRLARLCQTVLQPLRDEVARVYKIPHSFSITSGYRPDWLNSAVGGAPNSDHMYGRATDFEVMGISNYDMCKFIETYIPILPIEKLIYEFGEWVHISIPEEGKEPSRKVMTAIHDPETKGTRYLPGIIKQEEK